MGDDNIYAHIIRDQESQQSALEVKFFDDNLIFTDGFELPLENHVITASNQGFLLDKNNDIILEYHSWVDSMRYFARVGLDGTLKYKHGVSLRDMPINHYFEGFKVFGESPLEYVVWGINATQVNPEFTRTFDLYILDSLFMPQQRFTLNDNNAYEGDYHYGYGLQDKVLRLDDGTFVTATQYKK